MSYAITLTEKVKSVQNEGLKKKIIVVYFDEQISNQKFHLRGL